MLRGLDNGRSHVVGPTCEIRALCYPVGLEMTLVGGELNVG
jgi:hypothetical protein